MKDDSIENNLCALGNKRQFFVIVFLILLCIPGLVWFGSRNFLLYHSLIELFSILIAFMMFVIVVNQNKIMNVQSSFVTVLGVAYFFVGIFDMFHTLAYKGMGVFAEESANLSTQLWVISRYIESISICVAGLLIGKRVKIRYLFLIYAVLSAIIFASVFDRDIFPACFIEGIGLTPFKIISELIIICLLASGLIIYTHMRHSLSSSTNKLFIMSVIFTILSEICFTLYEDVYSFWNVLGHIFKLISFFYIYKAIVQSSLLAPYKELKKSQQQYSELIDLLPEALVIYTDSAILFANKKAFELFGIRNLCELSPIRKQISDNVKLSGCDILNDYPFTAKDGSITNIEITRTPCVYYDQTATLVMVRDISQRKKAEILERNLKIEEERFKQVLEYDKLKTEFFSNVSHELKTPLSILLCTAQLLEAKIKEKTVRQYIGSIKQNTYRMIRLINNLLDMTKIDSGFYQLSFQNIDIAMVIESIVLSTAHFIESKGIRLEFHKETEKIITACDPDAIERIILNLLSNAAKFTEKNGKISVRVYSNDSAVFVSVHDTGIGIPLEKQELIFKRFVQSPQTHSHNHMGTGIGLSLVASLVKLHKGSIRIESTPGQGSEFTIELPMLKAAHEDTHAHKKGSHANKLEIEFSDLYY